MLPNLPAITVETPPFLDIGVGGVHGRWGSPRVEEVFLLNAICMRGIPGSFFLLEAPSLNRKVGESAWCGCGCGWAQVEPLKIVETLHGLSLQTQLTGKVWVGDGDVHSWGISTDAREQGIQVTDLCPSLLSADFLGDFRFKPAAVITVEGYKECVRVLDQWENIGFWCEFC